MKPPPRARSKPLWMAEDEADSTCEQADERKSSRWRRAEKKQLLTGLKALGAATGGLEEPDWNYLQEHVPSRSTEEIRSMVEVLKQQVFSFAWAELRKAMAEEKKRRRPVEEWTELAAGLTGSLEEAVTSAFSKILVVSSTEPRTMKNRYPPVFFKPASCKAPAARKASGGKRGATKHTQPVSFKTPTPTQAQSQNLPQQSRIFLVANPHSAKTSHVPSYQPLSSATLQLAPSSGSIIEAAATTQQVKFTSSSHPRPCSFLPIPSSSSSLPIPSSSSSSQPIPSSSSSLTIPSSSSSQPIPSSSSQPIPFSSSQPIPSSSSSPLPIPSSSSTSQPIPSSSSQPVPSSFQPIPSYSSQPVHSSSSQPIPSSSSLPMPSSCQPMPSSSSTSSGTTSVTPLPVTTASTSDPGYTGLGQPHRDYPKPPNIKDSVDFQKIYYYLNGTLRPEKNHQLTAMESAVVLDLLMSLPEELPQLDLNKLNTHLLQVHQCFSAPAHSKRAKLILADLKAGLGVQEPEETSRIEQKTAQLSAQEPHSQSTASHISISQSEDNNWMEVPPLNPFMIPLTLLQRKKAQ